MAVSGKRITNAPTDISYVKSFIDNALTQSRPFLVSAALNAEYIRGNQNLRVNKLRIEPVPKATKIYKERKVFNRINPIYLSRYGILSNNMPIPGFKPVNFNIGRFNNYAEGNKFISDFMTDFNFKQSIYNKAVKNADIGGLVWIKTGINWSKGDLLGEFEVEVKVEDNNQDEKTKYKVIKREGRPFAEVVPTSEIFVDNYYTDSIDEIEELVHRRAFTLEYIKRRWGIDAQPEILNGNDTFNIPNKGRVVTTGIAKKDFAYVYEYYKKPTAVHPDGLLQIFVGDRKIYEGELPFVNGKDGERKLPFDVIRVQTIPNYLYGITVYSQIIPIQDTFNAIKNRYLEYVNHTSIGQLYVWENSLVSDKISTTPGLVIRLKRNSKKPEAVEKTQIGAEFLQFLRMLEEDMNTSAGLSALTAHGQSKSNMRSDGVVDRIAESDQNKLVDALDSISEGFISVFKKILYLELYRQDFLKNELNMTKLDEYMIKYKLDEVDIEQLTIINREFLMQSDQLVDKKFQQVSALGIYNPEMQLSYVSKINILDSLGSNSLKETLDPTESATHDLIEEEHLLMLDNELDVTVEEWHLHQQHIFEHNLFRISKKVRDMRRKDPDGYKVLMQLLDKHIKEHEHFSQESKDSFAHAKAQIATAPQRR